MVLTTKTNRFSNEVLPHIQQQIMAKALQFVDKTHLVMFGFDEAKALEDGTILLPQDNIPETIYAEIEGKTMNFKFASE